MFFNRLATIVCAVILCSNVFAQGKQVKLKFGDIKPEDFKPEYYAIDSSADAVYLYSSGSSRYDYSGNKLAVFLNVHKRIRLVHKKSFDDLATIKIPLDHFGYNEDLLQNFQASTYTFENGKVITTKVDKSSIFKDKEGEDRTVKFTFPNLTEGCIIEYSYTKVIANYTNLPSWNFQNDYPQLWNEYSVEAPVYLDFVALHKGYLEPVIDTISSSYSSYFDADMVKHTWAFQNVEVLKNEPFVTSLSNYRQSIEFQVSALRIHGRDPQYFMHTWPETVDDLMKDEGFGASLTKGNGWLKDDVKQAINGETDLVIKAKNIYDYVKENFTCTDYSAKYLSQPLKKTEQLKKGNVADINMLLIAMLRESAYEADPVLLSTRGHGKTIDVYPIMSKFNYLIARLIIQDKTYLLDAAEPVLAFGHLGKECYNGNARVIAAEPILIDLSADSLHQTDVTSLFLSNDENGIISGTYKYVMAEAQSEDMREKMKKMNVDEYFKDLKKTFSVDVDITNKTIDSIKELEMPVSLQYNISFKPEEDILYFNPVWGETIYKENPFSAAQRFYPVEMPYCMDETYILNMQVPEGYKVDELPKSARVSLNETEGMFEYLIQQGGDHIQLRCRIKLNKATFEPDDYETLRKFFAFVVEKENEQIVFKKL